MQTNRACRRTSHAETATKDDGTETRLQIENDVINTKREGWLRASFSICSERIECWSTRKRFFKCSFILSTTTVLKMSRTLIYQSLH